MHVMCGIRLPAWCTIICLFLLHTMPVISMIRHCRFYKDWAVNILIFHIYGKVLTVTCTTHACVHFGPHNWPAKYTNETIT